MFVVVSHGIYGAGGRGGKTDWLHFNGINYRANIWLNGQKVADAKDVAGTYRTFEFNVTKFLKRGERNALAVEVFAPGKDDLGITWVDWNPTPPDKDMGIWKEVFLTQSAAVSVRNPFVSSKLSANYKAAALTVSADLQNSGEHAVRGVLRAEIGEYEGEPAGSTGRRGNKNGAVLACKICGIEIDAISSVVAVHHGGAVSLFGEDFFRGCGACERLGDDKVWRTGSYVGADGQGFSSV